ncbi:TadA family conjugal transfer-associated ATPase [Corynebacterium uberis]|uniref:TadA family conjugal transfer-associated ATPase n=1 Tax=Corynebacterium uberis TaxID=2883169 RepID=UPI001D0B6C69|nr:TadA family conjugal transfer-associated ATPase [Corynebacterium uberis]UDL73126.1 TadA family conjugal transfer-associated ATPase [Corynebacterium uberis]UDL75997.1 TadA family conjugal transfer-associated ATPase [Corynebacterium uberis]UDL78209.1 TadA family conjugal transfer-associated ATPase [Corynebacterium uberis]UDL80492.1 TadA family conjugal transfer-associated ATPase [Corynebacterium uberis]UDL82627.1 TadA family conjugal transfer-associated ATPase [Corynebacterium uberis]
MTAAATTRHDALVHAVQARLARSAGSAALDADALANLVREEAGVISDLDMVEVLRQLRHESHGTGALEPLLSMPGVTDVLVNGPDSIWFDRGCGLERATSISLGDDAAVRRLATRLAHSCGTRLDDAQPFAGGRLLREDGSTVRMHAVLAPPSESGTCLSLRVLRQATLSVAGLVERGTLSPALAAILQAMVARRWSFLIVGGTGSGKTTLLSALLSLVPDTERILCIEDTPELAPRHPHVVNLVGRPANVEGHGQITLSMLLRQGLRMRPDRIVVGEIRGAEIVDLLAALNTGHDGGAGTAHANSIAEVPARIEALAALGGLERTAAHSQLAAAVRVILVMRRGADAKRRLAQVGTVRRGADGLVETTVVWDVDAGPQPGFAPLCHALGVPESLPEDPELCAAKEPQ